MQRKKSTKDTRNAAYQKLKQQFDLYVEFNTANQRELREKNKEVFHLTALVKQLERQIDEERKSSQRVQAQNARMVKELYQLRDSGLYADAKDTYEALPIVCEAIIKGEKWSI